MDQQLPNAIRNKEVSDAVQRLKESDTGDLAIKPAGIAGSLSSLDVAEALQMLQLQLIETSKENRTALHSVIDKLIASNAELSKSNIKYAGAMMYLTAALVLVGVAPIVVSLWATIR